LPSEPSKNLGASARTLADPSARLEEREETLEMILDNLGEGVLATDLEGKPLFANPKAREILDLGDERPPRRMPDYFGDCDLREMIARCATRRACEERWVRGHDTLFRVKFDHLPKFDNHRGGVLIMIRDLSQERRLEMNQQRFLANAAHELKTPITTIIGAAELLLTGADEDPEARRRFLEHILSEGRRMQRLSDTLLRLARIGAERREPNLQTVDPEGVARRAAERIEPLAQSAEVELRVNVRRECRVRADPEQLEQVLLALLSNAVQHSERGSNVRLRVDGGTFNVEDKGSGIDPEALPHLFERFFRGKGSAGGFGLGLSICRDLVEGMGGRISVRSREGEGTTAEVRLPEEVDA
jgi:two-component system phosphate regulon sensor histidine kinase PhoR